MDTPHELRDYFCDDYFASRWADEGYYSETAQLMVVEPAINRVLRPEIELLVIGRPGVDGIEFGYRRGLRGIWAYYGMFGEWALVAESTADLVDGWATARISV
jgi:hypothetical protein